MFGVHLVPVGLVNEVAFAAGGVFEWLRVEGAACFALWKRRREEERSGCEDVKSEERMRVELTYSRDDGPVSNPAVRASRIVVRVGDADGLLLVDSVLAGDVHEVAATSLRSFDHLGSPQKALASGNRVWKGSSARGW